MGDIGKKNCGSNEMTSGHNRAEGTEGKARFCAIHALRRMVWQSGGGSEEASEKGKRGSVQITRSDQWSCGLEAAAEKQALPGGRKHQVTLDCGAHSGGSLEAAAKEVQMSSRKVLVKRGKRWFRLMGPVAVAVR
jgi:hypothetical protein